MYELTSRNATKYFWFTIKESVSEGTDFVQKIREKKFNFSPFSGTSDADQVGSTLGIYFYSERVLELFNQEFSGQFSFVEISCENIGSNRYYYIEPKRMISRIPLVNALDDLEVSGYIERGGLSRSNLFWIGSGLIHMEKAELDSIAIFGVEGMRVFLITTEGSRRIKRETFKNLEMTKLYKYEEFA